jgi:hypothetical protein
MKSNNPDINNYHAIRHLSRAIDSYFEAYEFSNDNKKDIAYNPKQYSWKDITPYSPASFNAIPSEDAAVAQRYGAHLLKRIQDLRANRKYVPPMQTVIEKAREATKINGVSSLNDAFPSITWEVSPYTSGSMYCEKLRGVYGVQYEIGIPVTWGKRVYEQGIDNVKAGDGMRFIMDAQERKLDRLNDIGIRAFSVVALAVKHKEAMYDNAWVMKYETSGEPVTAIQAEFSKCESLITRRIKDTVTKELMDF